MEVLHELQGALGATGDAIGQKVDIFEPDNAFAAKHRHGLHALAETVQRGLDLAHVGGEAVDCLAGKFVGELGGEGGETLRAHPADEVIVLPADESERFRRSHGVIWRGSGRGRTKKIASVVPVL